MPQTPRCSHIGPPSRVSLAIYASVAFGLTSPAVLAQELILPSWDFEPGVRIDLLYDDNVRLSETDPQSSFGSLAELYALASRRTEFSDLTFRASVDNIYYSDISDLDTTDGAVGASYAYRTDRATFGLISNFIYDTTLTSEEETTGIVQISRRRSFFDVTPSVEYATSERSRIGADFTFQDVSYEDVEDILLSDYQFARFGLSGEYDLSERATLVTRLFYEEFDSKQNSDQFEAYGADAGVRYQISDRMRLTALAGARSADAQSDAIGVGDDGKSTGPIFEVALERDYGPGLFAVSLARSLIPSGRGTLLDTTRAEAVFSLPVTERGTARIRALGVRNRNPGGEVNVNDRDFLLISPGFRWRLGESTWLDLSYRYRFQDREITDDDAESNAVFLGFGHDWVVR